MRQRLARDGDRLARLEQLRLSLNPDRPLNLGFARVHRADGTLVRNGASLQSGEAVRLRFADIEKSAVIDGAAPSKPGKPKPAPAAQGDLF